MLNRLRSPLASASQLCLVLAMIALTASFVDAAPAPVSLEIRQPEAPVLDKRISNPFTQPYKVSATSIGLAFAGVECVGTTCMALGGAGTALGATINFFGSLIPFVSVGGVTFGSWDWRVKRSFEDQWARFESVRAQLDAPAHDHHRDFVWGARNDAIFDSPHGRTNITRLAQDHPLNVNADGTRKNGFTIRYEYIDPVKRSPGSIEGYVSEVNDDGYPPDNGYVSEAANMFGNAMMNQASDQQAFCGKMINIFQSKAFLYMAIDGDDINDSFTSTVGCENLNYDYDYFEA